MAPHQPDLFEAMGLTAKEGARLGAQRALDHADATCEGWSTKAAAYVRAYATTHPLFMAEDCRAWAHARGLPVPPDSRAWGGVITQAAAAGLITRNGYAMSKRPPGHARPMAVWRSHLCGGEAAA